MCFLDENQALRRTESSVWCYWSWLFFLLDWQSPGVNGQPLHSHVHLWHTPHRLLLPSIATEPVISSEHTVSHPQMGESTRFSEESPLPTYPWFKRNLAWQLSCWCSYLSQHLQFLPKGLTRETRRRYTSPTQLPVTHTNTVFQFQPTEEEEVLLTLERVNTCKALDQMVYQLISSELQQPPFLQALPSFTKLGNAW